MPDQNPPTPAQSMTPPTPAAAPPPPPADPRPNFVAFEETAPSNIVPTTPPMTSPPPAPARGSFSPPPPPSASSNVVVPSGGSRKKIFIIIGVVILLLLVLGGILFAMQSRQSAPPTPTATPEAIAPTAYCSSVRAYDIEGNSISSTALTSLQPGSIVRFAASGISSNGAFDKARFTINGVQRPEVTTKISGTDEFYDEFQIPEGVTTFNVTAEVHLVETDTWY